MALVEADFWRLKNVENMLVATGGCVCPGESAALAALVSEGCVTSPTLDSYVMTSKGWRIAHAFRKHVAEHGEIGAASFVAPQSPQNRAKIIEMAREAFVKAIVATPAADPAVVVERVLAAAATFVAREDLEP